MKEKKLLLSVMLPCEALGRNRAKMVFRQLGFEDTLKQEGPTVLTIEGMIIV